MGFIDNIVLEYTTGVNYGIHIRKSYSDFQIFLSLYILEPSLGNAQKDSSTHPS